MHDVTRSDSQKIADPSPPCILLDRTYNGSFEPAKNSVVSNIAEVDADYTF